MWRRRWRVCCGIGSARIEFAGLKYLAPQSNGLTLLRDDPVVLGMIDGGDLPADRITADVNDGEMIGHGTRVIAQNRRHRDSRLVTSWLNLSEILERFSISTEKMIAIAAIVLQPQGRWSESARRVVSKLDLRFFCFSLSVTAAGVMTRSLKPAIWHAQGAKRPSVDRDAALPDARGSQF